MSDIPTWDELGQPKPAVNQPVRVRAQRVTNEMLDTLIAIAQDPEAPHSARVAAADKVLDRGWGKAPQALTGEDGTGPVQVQTTVVHEHQP